MRKRYLIYYILIFLLVIGLMTTFTGAYLTDQKEAEKELIVGNVSVFEVKVYYLNALNEEVEYDEVQVLTQSKRGVYEVNIVNPSALNYITNLRVDFYISSNVDSYLRLKLMIKLLEKLLTIKT